jgi:hypothetical protein
MLGEGADQGFGRLVGDQRDADRPRVFQARGEEADSLGRPVDILDVHLPEVVLTEFTGQALKPDERGLVLRPDGRNEGKERGLLARVPHEAHATQHLDGLELGLLLEQIGDGFPEILDQAGPADAPRHPRRRVVDLRNGAFLGDPLDRPDRDPGELRHLRS